MRNKEEIDQETTIADMSFLDSRKKKFPKFYTEENENKETLKGKNLMAFIKGTLLATLLIGFVYIVVYGLFIFFLSSWFKRL